MPTVARQSPIKVDPDTKDRIRFAAAMLGRNQSEVVGLAVCEFVERHADEFRRGIEEAKKALALGPEETTAFVTGLDQETIRRVSGK